VRTTTEYWTLPKKAFVRRVLFAFLLGLAVGLSLTTLTEWLIETLV